jgi:hypothetical protein
VQHRRGLLPVPALGPPARLTVHDAAPVAYDGRVNPRVFFVFALVSLGCGGVVEMTEDGGEGAAGGLGGSGPVPTTNSTTITMSVTTGPVSTCEVFCDLVNACDPASNCATACSQMYVPGCEPLAENRLQCLIDAYSQGCDVGADACVVESQVHTDCVTNDGCLTNGCFSAGDWACACTGLCLNVALDQRCDLPEPGPGGSQAECECIVQGQVVGTCFQDAAQCVIEDGCCRAFVTRPQPG